MAVPVAALLGGSVLANVLGGAFGQLFSSGDKARVEELLRQAMDEYGNVDLPTLERLSRTALADIQVDPQAMGAQSDALAAMGRYAQGGLTLGDKAGLNEALNQTNAVSRGQRAAIMQQHQARSGGGGAAGGSELAALLEANSAAAGRANQAGLDAAGRASDRAFDAWVRKYHMGSEMADRDWQRKSQVAKATDLINEYNANLGQRAFENQMRLAGARAGTAMSGANAYGQRAHETQSMWGGAGHGVAQGMQAGAMYGVGQGGSGGSGGGYAYDYGASNPDDYYYADTFVGRRR